MPLYLFSMYHSKMNQPETDEELHLQAYKTMAFFEEAVETLEMSKYNLQGVRFNRVNQKAFYFVVPVNDNNNCLHFKLNYNLFYFLYPIRPNQMNCLRL